MRAYVLGLLGLGASALAVNVPQVRSYGFSSDLRYYAYERFWTADGSGFPQRELYVLDAMPLAVTGRWR